MEEEKKNEEQDNSMDFVSCDAKSLQCSTCVWAYVFRCKPTMRSCGKFSVKPKNIYFKSAKCPKYEALKNI